MIRWKLAEVMTRYRISSKVLAERLGISQTAISNLRKAEVLPEIGSHRLCQLAEEISALAQVKITPFDLMEYQENNSYQLIGVGGNESKLIARLTNLGLAVED